MADREKGGFQTDRMMMTEERRETKERTRVKNLYFWREQSLPPKGREGEGAGTPPSRPGGWRGG